MKSSWKHVTVQSSPDLKIVLNGRNTFIAGETISGYVSRKSHFVDPNACVLIRLCGHTEWIIQVSGGMSSRLIRNRIDFFEDSSEALTLHQGPLHIPQGSPGGLEWPFAITLPINPRQGAIGKIHEKERAYLPLSDASSQQLPPSVTVRSKGSSKFMRGHVEYFLEAQLLGSSKRKENHSFHAVQPLNVQLMTPATPVADLGTKQRSTFKQTIASQRLVPGVSKLSVGQKMQKALASSKVPHYSFSLQMDFANVLLIGNPNPIPLRLWMKPLWNHTSEILQDLPHKVVVKRLFLGLKAKTSYTSRNMNDVHHKSTHVLVDYTSQAVVVKKYHNIPNAAGEPLENSLPDSDALIVPVDDKNSPLDLGASLGVRAPLTSTELGISPTFMTFNMKNVHFIEYKLELAVAEEMVHYDGKEPVLLLGPSCSWL